MMDQAAFAIQVSHDQKVLQKYEYVYDEYYDCYICPNNQVLSYRTTNRDGYREYKSSGTVCENCPYLEQCTKARSCRLLPHMGAIPGNVKISVIRLG